MTNVHQFPGKRQEQPALETLKCVGVSRDKDCPNSLQIITNRPPTDDEMRAIHESVQDLVHFAYLSTLKEHGET
jgi:hypothetical protein